MDIQSLTLKELRIDILLDFKRFISGLDAGASDEQLVAILGEIKEKELLLIKGGGAMLAPEMWRLMHSRLTGRQSTDIIDTTI